MRNVILHYELPGKIGNTGLGTKSVDEVVDKLQHIKQVVENIESPSRETNVSMGWYSEKKEDFLPNLTLGVKVLSAEKYFKKLVDTVISNGGVPDYISAPDWNGQMQDAAETFNLVEKTLKEYGARILGSPKEEGKQYKIKKDTKK